MKLIATGLPDYYDHLCPQVCLDSEIVYRRDQVFAADSPEAFGYSASAGPYKNWIPPDLILRSQFCSELKGKSRQFIMTLPKRTIVVCGIPYYQQHTGLRWVHIPVGSHLRWLLEQAKHLVDFKNLAYELKAPVFLINSEGWIESKVPHLADAGFAKVLSPQLAYLSISHFLENLGNPHGVLNRTPVQL